MATIDVEAKKLRNLITDVDKHRRRFLKKEGSVTVQFVSPEIVTYEKFRYYLLKNSVKKKVEQKFHYRPDYFSYEEYSVTGLWTLLLYINDMASIEDFTKSEILVPTHSAILDIARDNQISVNLINLDASPEVNTNTLTLQLFSTKVKPKLSIFAAEETTVATSVFFIRQKFDLTDTNIDNGFIDLAYVPHPESVDIAIASPTQVKLSALPVYNKDYVLIDDISGDAKRLSWKAVDNALGDGMDGTLEVNDILEVRYAKDEDAN